MKKNKSMRAAGGLMIATLLSTSIVSGTYAKYVTSDSASDTARVAKFGVTVTASGSLFDKTYLTTSNTPGGTEDANGTVLSVESNGAVNNIENVVAPGTKNTDGITFVISGKPEVDVKLDVVVEDKENVDDFEEIFLAKKTELPDMTTGNATDTFDNAEYYYPVKFTLTQTKGTGTPTTLVNKGNISEVKSKLEGLSQTSITANTDLSTTVGTLKLTWEWDFDDTEKGTYDKQDTLLGDLAAGTALTPLVALTDGTDYNLEEKIGIAISVTQID